MVKNVIEVILFVIMWPISKVFSYWVASYWYRFCCKIYTFWIRNFVGSLGFRTVIAYPCSLQGGGRKLITIGDYSVIQSHSVLGCWTKYGNQIFTPSIAIGSHCSIGEYNHITACNKITIGDGLLTGRFVYIGDNAHGGLSLENADIPPVHRHLISKGEIIIGRNVWIGDKVSIFGGVTIGDNVIIGAGSIVTHDVPSNCMVAGAPAKIIKSCVDE